MNTRNRYLIGHLVHVCVCEMRKKRGGVILFTLVYRLHWVPDNH